MALDEVVRFEHSAGISKRVWCTNWRHDGRILLSAGEDRAVRIWAFDKDKKSATLETQIVGDNIRTIRSACFAPNGRFLATASFDASVVLYEQEDGTFEQRHKLDGHENEVKCVAFSRSGQYLATSSRDKTVFIWQFDEDEDVEVDAVLQSHSGDVKFVSWHPEEDTLVSGGYDCSLIFYRYDGDEWLVQQKVQNAHDDTVWCAKFNSTGDYLASSGGDSRIKVWKKTPAGPATEATKWSCIATLDVPYSKWPIYTVCWDSFSNKFAAGGGDRLLWLFELDTSTDEIKLLDSHKFSSDINCVTFNPAHCGLASLALDDGNVVVVQLEL